MRFSRPRRTEILPEGSSGSEVGQRSPAPRPIEWSCFVQLGALIWTSSVASSNFCPLSCHWGKDGGWLAAWGKGGSAPKLRHLIWTQNHLALTEKSSNYKAPEASKSWGLVGLDPCIALKVIQSKRGAKQKDGQSLRVGREREEPGGGLGSGHKLLTLPFPRAWRRWSHAPCSPVGPIRAFTARHWRSVLPQLHLAVCYNKEAPMTLHRLILHWAN